MQKETLGKSPNVKWYGVGEAFRDIHVFHASIASILISDTAHTEYNNSPKPKCRHQFLLTMSSGSLLQNIICKTSTIQHRLVEDLQNDALIGYPTDLPLRTTGKLASPSRITLEILVFLGLSLIPQIKRFVEDVDYFTLLSGWLVVNDPAILSMKARG
jgi:hypothetical protein